MRIEIRLIKKNRLGTIYLKKYTIDLMSLTWLQTNYSELFKNCIWNRNQRDQKPYNK